MLNDGVFGIKETIFPEIRDAEVFVGRRLDRYTGDAAVPPGQAVELEFSVAAYPFTLSIHNTPVSISTTERAPRPQRDPAVRPPRRPGTDTGSLSPVSDTRVITRATDVTGAIGTRVLEVTSSEGTVVPAGAVARMRGIDTTLFGNMLDGGVVVFPPPDIPDPIIPFEIVLTPPNGLEPMVFTNPKRSRIDTIPSDEVVGIISPEFIKKGRGLWKVTVRNINPIAHRIRVIVHSTHAIAPLQKQEIPLSLLNHLMASVLKKSLPTLTYANGGVVVQTPTHFLGLMGVNTEFSISNVVTSLIDSLPTFSPINAAIESRAALVTRITNRREALKVEYGEQIRPLVAQGAAGNTQAGNRALALGRRLEKAVAACNASIARLNAMLPSRAVFCVVVEGMFSDAPISLDYVGTVALIDNKLPQIALIFDDRMQLTDVVSNLAVDLSPALAKVVLATGALVALSAVALTGIFAPLGIALAIFGGITLYNSIDDLNVEEKIRLAILGKGPAISHFIKGSFERISAVGAIALRSELLPRGAADGADALRISYYDPATAVAPRPRNPLDDIRVEGFETVRIAAGTATARAPSAITFVKPANRAKASEKRVRLARETAGPIPEGFAVGSPESIARLDQHSTIVVLMMENRSFDHYFHDLAATFPNRGYTSVPAGFTNAPPPGFVEPIGVTKMGDVGIGNSLIFRDGQALRSLDPEHNFEHTMFQIGGGTHETAGTGDMNGFARDFAEDSDSPQIVMSYFGMDALPVYRVLADHYAVCDRWFASLPVGTYPNRLSALQGNVPFLHNISQDDPAIGYLEDYSIFDLLNSQGISWKFFESDIGTLRLYDRFRLDVANVRPIAELETTLRTGRDTGQLPRVMFIEPEFLFGNDDHPPMDIRAGQEFVKQVIGKFIDFGLLDRSLFLLTYDEHGGFFDHVAPPGTPRGPAEWLGKVESLFPQQPDIAPTCMGVRIPSMAMSKFISNQAKHTVLDHTSILKTILLHNRFQISTAQFSRFGNRVMKGAHFGELMDLQVPRTIDYRAIAQAMNYQSGNSWFNLVEPSIVEGRAARLNPSHPASVLRGIAQPRARRFTGS